MTIFNDAWVVVKMPFHGTTLENAKRILEEDEMRSNAWLRRGDEKIYASSLPTTALQFALDTANRTTFGPGDARTPALLHIPDDLEPLNTYDDQYGHSEVQYQGPLKPSEHGIKMVWSAPFAPKNQRDHWVDLAEEFARDWVEQNRGKDTTSIRRTNRFWDDEYMKERMKRVLRGEEHGFVG